MCGLAGIVIKEEKRNAGQMASIRHLAGELLMSAQVRGDHATGLAIIDRDGQYLIHKRALPAKELVATDEFEAAIALIDENTGAVIGHTRYATQGSPKISKNNHPIRAGSVIGAHNGWVSNDDELFSKYGLKRFAEVDSEVLFRMLDSAETPDDFYKDMLKNVQGKVSMVWADVEYPEHVYIFKGNNPLEMVFIKSLGVYAYASTLEILKEALLYGGIIKYRRAKIKDWTAIRIDTKTFNMVKTGGVKIQKAKKRTTYYNTGGYNYGSGWTYSEKYGGYLYTSHETPKTKVAKESDTVDGYVPRYSYRDKLVKTDDGSQIKMFEFKNKKKGNK